MKAYNVETLVASQRLNYSKAAHDARLTAQAWLLGKLARCRINGRPVDQRALAAGMRCEYRHALRLSLVAAAATAYDQRRIWAWRMVDA